jgi:RNA polymerase sigma-70 factor, ECF subfamily
MPETRLMDEAATEGNWREWVEQNAPRFLLYARQKARNEPDAQDLVQEALLEAAQRQPNGALPPTALVFATIHRRAIDLARGEDRRLERERAVAEKAGTSWFDTSVEDREMRQQVESVLKRLPESYREVVMLKIWGELTFAEVASVLGVPANTAASRYRYGLAEMRKLMKGVLA